MKRISSLLLVFLFFATLIGGGGWLLFGRHNTFSERENRVLASPPKLTAHRLLSGRYSEDLAAFCRDRIPFRTELISLCGLSQLTLGRCEYNGVLIGKDGYLITKPQPNESVTEQNLQAYRSLQDRCRAAHIPCHLVLAPRAADVLPQQLPTLYGNAEDQRLLQFLEAQIPNSTALTDAFLQADDPATLRYRTDHHWTTDGAYLAYKTMGELLGYTPMEPQFFERVTVSASFLGTLDSKVCLPNTTPDAVVLYRYQGDGAVCTVNHTQEQQLQGFYDFTALAKKDCYRIFLGGNTAHLSISLPTNEAKPKMLLIKDSFANSVIPFLALHYDLEVVDPRYDDRPLSQWLEEDHFDQVLFLCGVDTFSEHSGFLGK